MQLPLHFCKTRKVKTPSYGTPGSGCLDFYMPQFDDDFLCAFSQKNVSVDYDKFKSISDSGQIILQPGEDACIPSGIHVKLLPYTALTAFNKSGVATRLKLIRGAEYVDSDYMGEIHLHVINVGKEQAILRPDEKVVQFAYVPVYTAILKEYQNKTELYDGFVSDRGEGNMGSTGSK